MNSPQSGMREPLPADFEQLSRWALIVALMAFGSECLLFALAGYPITLAFMKGGNGGLHWLSLMGTFFGVPAAVLWLGGQVRACGRFLRPAALVLGLVDLAWRAHDSSWNSMSGASGALPVLVGPLGILELGCALVDLVNARIRRQPMPAWPRLYLLMGVLLGGLGIVTRSALECTKHLFPATWDYHLYRIDAAFGPMAARAASLTEVQGPWLQTLSVSLYAVLVPALYGVVAVAVRKHRVREINAWRVLVVPYMLAFVAYAWLPLSGPQYAFFDGRFPNSLPDPMSVTALPVIIPPSYRNGMPSMHLTAALLVWMMATALRHRVSVVLASLLVIGTAWSTLALGEHYVLDLVVAAPFAAFLGVALMRPSALIQGWRQSGAVWLCGLVFATWMLLLRIAPVWLSLHQAFVQALSVLGLLAAATVWARMSHLVPTLPVSTQPPADTTAALVPAPTVPRWVTVTFITSGFAGLVYEVVYAKALAVTFGSTALASYTVLTVYMGGMALGAWLGGRLADRVGRPLHVYGVVEAMIGLYAAVTPLVFSLIQSVYVTLALDTPPDAPALTALRVLLGVAGLGLPTVLMGTTLPLMFKYLRARGISSGDAIAPLYSANVIGAALGAVLAGYLLLPALGRDGATNAAAVISLLVALYAIERAKQAAPVERVAEPLRDIDAPPAAAAAPVPVGRLPGLTALAILLIGGALTLGLEVNAMHLLATVAGNSVYAFALMLGTFLTGLSLGSVAGHRLLARFTRLDVVAFAQYGLAATIGLTALLWDQLPSYFGSFGEYPVGMSFAAREAVRAITCTLAMVPVAFCIGVSYPAAMSLVVDWLSPSGGARGLGVASGFNTLGNILGVLIVGFFLLPQFGSRDVTVVLAVAAFVLGSLALGITWKTGGRAEEASPRSPAGRRLGGALALASLGSIALIPGHWDLDELASGSNVYFRSQQWGAVVDHAESVEGGFTSVARNDHGVSTLLTNGKFQGNDSAGGEMVAQESFALFPLLHSDRKDSALIIGYGTGMTARVLHEAGFRNLEVAELSRDIVALADKHFPTINHGVSSAPGVKVNYTDGRNYLLTQTRQFDVISVEITSIWFAGAANLYNRDFYSLARKRLRPDGVLQQWVQLHHMVPIDLLYVIGSVRSEFRYVWLYVRGGQGIIVASNSEHATQYPGVGALAARAPGPGDERHPDQLRRLLVLSPRGVDNLMGRFDPTLSVLVSTDKNLYLEHATPKGNALGDVLGDNIRRLAEFEPAASAPPPTNPP